MQLCAVAQQVRCQFGNPIRIFAILTSVCALSCYCDGFFADRTLFASTVTCAEPADGPPASSLPERYRSPPHHIIREYPGRLARNATLATTTLGPTIACITTVISGFGAFVSRPCCPHKSHLTPKTGHGPTPPPNSGHIWSTPCMHPHLPYSRLASTTPGQFHQHNHRLPHCS